MNELGYPSRIVPAADVPRTVRGRWRPTFFGLRGAPDTAESSFVWYCYVDGEKVQGPNWAPARDLHRDGKRWSEWTFDIDTARFPDDAHEVLVYGYPDGPQPDAHETWHTHWTGMVRFANGPVPMALLPSVEQAVVADDRAVVVTARVLRCDGTVVPADEPVVLSTDAGDRVAIDGASFRLRGEGWATIVAACEGLTAAIRAGRYPADAEAIPHLGRDWTVRRRWDARASRFVIAPFYQRVDDAMADPKLATALREAGLSTFHADIGGIPEHADAAAFMRALRERTRGWREFVRAQGAEVHLVGDGVARRRVEARASLDRPEARAAYADAVAYWKQFAGFGISVVDEAAMAYRETPTPRDRRWDHLVPPVRVSGMRGPLRIRAGDADYSRLPVVPPPKDADEGSDHRPRVYVRTGTGPWRMARLVRGGPRGELTVATPLDAQPGDTLVVGGWWADADTPLPDDALVRINAMLEGIPRSWPPPGAAPGPAYGAWFALGDFADVYFNLVPGNDATVHPRGGATLPQLRDGLLRSVHRAQDHTSPALPMFTSVGATGPAYAKRTSERVADFRPGVDKLVAGGARPVATALNCALALVEGACGVRPYFFDAREQREQRRRETFPRTVLGEMLQTGFHPFAAGSAREVFRAIANFRRLLDALGAEVFAPLGMAPALGPGLRASRRGRVLLVANTREVVLRTVPFAIPRGTRWRYTWESVTREPLAASAEGRMSLAPGELSALVADA